MRSDCVLKVRAHKHLFVGLPGWAGGEANGAHGHRCSEKEGTAQEGVRVVTGGHWRCGVAPPTGSECISCRTQTWMSCACNLALKLCGRHPRPQRQLHAARWAGPISVCDPCPRSCSHRPSGPQQGSAERQRAFAFLQVPGLTVAFFLWDSCEET